MVRRFFTHPDGGIGQRAVQAAGGTVHVLKDDAWEWGVGVTEEFDGALAEALARFATTINGSVSGETLAELLRSMDSPTWATASSQLQEDWRAVMQAVITRAGNRANDALDASKFLVDNPYTVAWLKVHGSELITYITEEARGAVRQAIYEGVYANKDPATIAREIRQQRLVGLLPQQIETIQNNRLEMLSNGATLGEAEAYVAQAARDALSYRTMNIARTEVMRGVNQGSVDAWQVARQQGLILPESRRIWITAVGDGRTCEICQGFHKVEATLDGMFISKGGFSVYAPPAHPRCRCSQGLITRVGKWAPLEFIHVQPLRLPWSDLPV